MTYHANPLINWVHWTFVLVPLDFKAGESQFLKVSGSYRIYCKSALLTIGGKSGKHNFSAFCCCLSILKYEWSFIEYSNSEEWKTQIIQ
jgi:hypothetical protein